MRNLLEIDLPEGEVFMQNTFDYTVMSSQNASNLFLWNIEIVGQ
jgi:hypothetical protein